MPDITTPLTPPQRQGNVSFAISIALLLLRLALGWTFIVHGYQLCFQLGPDKFAQFLHMPILPQIVWAYLACYGQLLGGISVFLGLLARLGALPLIVNMLVAIATVHAKNGFLLSAPQNPPGELGYEYNFNLIAMAAAILIAGPGLISLDALIFKRSLFACGPQPLDQPVPRAK